MIAAPLSRVVVLLGLLLVWGAVSPVSAKRVRIKLGTVAPKDSPWHQILLRMGQEWRKISAGEVTVTIYPGGIMGDEASMIKKMRIGQLHAVGISGAGMTHILPAVNCLQVPMMFQSYEEFDYVRNKITPRLENMLEDKGFKVLNWGDAGWVHFFTKRPATTLDDIRKMKLYTADGDPDMLELYKEFDFNPVPLAITDMLTALQTGLIEAFDVPPLLALANQWFGVANHMLDVKWAPLVGATVIREKAWQLVPEEQREEMSKAAREAGEKLRDEIRTLGDDAVEAMEKRGLKVVKLDAATRTNWQRQAQDAYPKLRGRWVDASLFDEVQKLRDEYRAKAAEKGNAREKKPAE